MSKFVPVPETANAGESGSKLLAGLGLSDEAGTPRGAQLQRGVVLGVSRGSGNAVYEVRVAGGEVVARRAESCVLQPEADDVVLVTTPMWSSDPTIDGGATATSSAGAGPDEDSTLQVSFIVAVLSRVAGAPQVWRAGAGSRLTVLAEQLELRGEQSMRLVAPLLEMAATRASWVLRALDVAGDSIRGASDKLEWVGKKLQTVSKWSAHSAGNYARTTNGADTVTAEHMMRTAQQTMTTRSTYSIMTAKQDMRIDGERIHMG